jgi:hypothetical protein
MSIFATPLQNLPVDIPTFMIAVPRCHENLFQIIRDNHDWLSESGASRRSDRETIYQKRINTQEDREKLERLIVALRTEKSELFIDKEYHPKPYEMKIQDYVAEFIKNKSVNTQYTFKSFYRIIVLPDGAEFDTENEYILSQRQEYLIIPLFIILKKGKTYEQMKVLSYNDDGTYNVNSVNPKHFWRVHPLTDEEEIEKKNKEIRDKVISSIT